MPQKKVRLAVLILLSALSMFWLTAHLWETLPIMGQFPQKDPDSVLFARILEQSILKEQAVQIDSYSCFPYQIRFGIAPFYRWFLYTAVSTYFTLFPASNIDPMHVAGVLPILFTWFTGLLIILFFNQVCRSTPMFLVCCFFMLPSCSAAFVSGFMRLDYDYLISFFIWAWLLMCLRFYQTRSNALQLLAGMIVAAFIATWSGSPLFFFFVTAFGFFLWLFDYAEAEDYLSYCANSLIVGAMVNILLISPQSLGEEYFSLAKYSYLQPLCILLGGFACLALYNVKIRGLPRKHGILLLALLSLFLGYFFRNQLSESTGLLFQRDPIHTTISEMRSLVSPPKLLNNSAHFQNLLEHFGLIIFIFPFFILLPWQECTSRGGRLLRFWIGLMICLSVYQIRYIRWLTIGSGLFYGISFFLLWKMARNSLRSDKWRSAWLLAVFIPLMVMQSMHNFFWIKNSMTLSEAQVELFNWVRKYTPPTSGYSDNNKPEYGILTHWDEGNTMAYYARRPSVVNNAMWGFKTMADTFSSKSEAEAIRLCAKYGIRYILVSPQRLHDAGRLSFWNMFKKMPEQPEYSLKMFNVEPDKDFDKNFYYWLRENLALTSRAAFKPSSHFRVAYVSDAYNKQILPEYFLFEVVAGAKVDISADPLTDISVSLELQIGLHKFLFKKNASSGEKGMISFVLPYSSSYKGGRVRVSEIYKASYYRDGKLIKASLVVDEESVLKGLNVTGDLKIVEPDKKMEEEQK